MSEIMTSNPFDSVKDLRRRVDFVAVSPDVQRFKNEVIQLVEPDHSPETQIHAIVGDYGTGKSHINHYLYYLGIDRDDILVSYVSCKDIVDKVSRDADLYGLLLSNLVAGLIEKAPADISEVLEKLRKKATGDEALKWVLRKAEEENENADITKEAVERIKMTSTLDKTAFFNIMSELKKDAIFNKQISRIIFIIDEFEIFASDHHLKQLQKVASLRDTIMRFPEMVWIFSCAGKSWETLSKLQVSTDMFDKNVTKPHFLPKYDKDDRREMIWARMLSRIENYSEDKRSEYSSDEDLMKEFCFPFYDVRAMKGSEVSEMIARPALYPRRMIANCYDFYEEYSKELKRTKNEKASFEAAKKELMNRHFFDLINENKYKNLEEKMIKIFNDASFKVNEGSFQVLFKQLFNVYLTKKINKDSDFTGFISTSEHLNYINKLMQRLLNIRKPIDRPRKKTYALMVAIEEELRISCLEEIPDHSSNRDIWAFKVNEYQPLGELPYLSELLHREIDKVTESDDIISEEEIKQIFVKILQEERKLKFNEGIYQRARRDLEEATKIESRENNTFIVFDRKKRDVDEDFKDEMKKVIRKEELDYIRFFENMCDMKSGFFLPPLVEDRNGWGMPVQVSSKGTRGKIMDQKVPVIFTEDISTDIINEISENGYSIIFSPPIIEEKFEERTGVCIVHKDRSIFDIYAPKDGNHRFILLTPSQEYSEQVDWLKWSQIMGYYDHILSIKKSVGTSQQLNTLLRYLRNILNHLPTTIGNRPDIRWREIDYYGLAFRDVGRQKMGEYVRILSEILTSDKYIFKEKERALAEDLCEIYPWLTLTKASIKKDDSKCTFQVFGSSVDQVISDITKLISEEPTKLDEIADKYLSKIEKKYKIQDECDSKEKKNTRAPIVLIIRALSEGFPEEFQIEDGKISRNTGDGDLPEYDQNLLDWILPLSISKNSSTATIISLLLKEAVNGRVMNHLKDLQSAKKIFDAIPEDQEDIIKYLNGKESSEVDNQKISRLDILQRSESLAKKFINTINEKMKYISEFQTDDYIKRTESFKTNIEEALKIKGLDKGLKSLIEEINTHSSFNKIDDKIDKIISSRKSLKKQIDIDPLDDIDYGEYAVALGVDESVLKKILDLHESIEGFSNSFDDTMSKVEGKLRKGMTDLRDDYLKFNSFLKNIIYIIHEEKDYYIIE